MTPNQPDSSREPRTEAGRALIRTTYGGKMRDKADFERLRDAILAIEDEVRAALRERVAGLATDHQMSPADVLRLLGDTPDVG